MRPKELGIPAIQHRSIQEEIFYLGKDCIKVLLQLQKPWVCNSKANSTLNVNWILLLKLKW